MDTIAAETLSKLTKGRRMESEEFWLEHAQKLQISNSTRKEYCRINSLNYDRFGYWLQRWSQKSASIVPVKLKAAEDIAITPKILCSIEFSTKQVLKIHDFSALQFILEKLR